MPETTPLIKAALNLRVGAGFDVYEKTPKTGTILPFSGVCDSPLQNACVLLHHPHAEHAIDCL